MSSTNKTANVGLNQWVRTDPFCMDDFNEDNAKIDTALGNNPWVKLLEVEVTESVNAVELDLADTDLSKYHELVLYSSNASIRLRPNNKIASNYTYLNYGNNWQSDDSAISFSSDGKCRICGNGDLGTATTYYFVGSFGGGNTYRCYRDFIGGTLQKLNCSLSSGNISVGTKFYLWGFKK